jgi:hypothetical protein
VASILTHTGIGNEAWCKAQLDALAWALQVSRDS